MYATTIEAEKLVDRLQAYGVQCDGEVVTQEYHEQVSYDDQMTLGQVAEAGGRISRLRFLTEYVPGQTRYYDVSYCHATLPGGKIVPVVVDFDSFWIPQRQVKGHLIEWAKQHGVYAKGLGLLDEGNWSVLR